MPLPDLTYKSPLLSFQMNTTSLLFLLTSRRTMASRAVTAPSLPALSFALLLLLLSLTSGGNIGFVQGMRTWCVAKPSSDDATLLDNINFACSQVDCSILQKGCACFYPDTLMSHASIAMNLYYQSRGKNYWNCYFKNSALVVTTDPSFGQCTYDCLN